ncbi:MAG: flagellar biosynthetic protein FliO [Betaproteobacteria bacterium]|nr:flagellar biosynthetic protein FliO [Betaproteobacteria bacterium]
MLIRLFIFLLLAIPYPAAAETAKSGYVPPAPVISTESTLQMIGALLLVLAVIVGGTWLLKRFALLPAAASGVVKVVAATGVGQRERVVVIEIDQTWLVLGVAPGRVNKLHTMSKPLTDPAAKPDHPPVETFAAQLDQSMEKDHA